MKKLTEAQYRHIGEAALTAYQNTDPDKGRTQASGRVAVQACLDAGMCWREDVLKEALAEPSSKEIQGWYSGVEGTDYPFPAYLRTIFANRLCKLTTPPDPAVEALLKSGLIGSADVPNPQAVIDLTKKIVAAVRESDAARGKEAGNE